MIGPRVSQLLKFEPLEGIVSGSEKDQGNKRGMEEGGLNDQLEFFSAPFSEDQRDTHPSEYPPKPSADQWTVFPQKLKRKFFSESKGHQQLNQNEETQEGSGC